MTKICDTPFGFEDGHIVRYCTTSGRLEVEFEFWNEKYGVLIFEGLIGLYDNGAIGVTVSSVCEVNPSELLSSLIRRQYEKPPAVIDWKHFRFLDLDDNPMFEVVAQSCSFSKEGD
jgi:hypothetical protein